MTNEVSVIDTINPVEVFKAGGARQILDAIRAEVASEVPDVSTAAGRKRIASLAYNIARSKTALDDAGKALADRLNAQLKPINAERKLIRDELDALKEEIRRPLTEYEDAEKARVDKLKARVNRFSELSALRDEHGNEHSSEKLGSRLGVISSVEIDDSWQEFKDEAERAKAAAVEFLTQAVVAKAAREAEQAELERLRQQQAEAERKAREERIAFEAATRARIEAEAAAKAEQERQARAIAEAAEREERLKREAIEAERRRIAAEEQAKLDAEAAAERARLAEIARQKTEQEQAERERLACEADKSHRMAINNAAVSCLMECSGVTQEQAREIVKSIARGKIAGVVINY